MNYHRRISSEEKLVILFSGGLDSAIAYAYASRLFDAVTGIFVNIGQPYADYERASVLTYKELTGANITILDYPFTQEHNYAYERATPLRQVIPGRNMTLAAIAANFGTTIWMNALYGELKPSMPDKDETFFRESSKLLSRTFERNIIVESPFWFMTKTDTVSLALNRLHMPKEVLTATCSCYNPSEVSGVRFFCGECLTCFKRKVAMVNSGITEKYLKDPFRSWYAQSVFDRRDVLEHRLIRDYRAAYATVGMDFDLIPQYVEEAKACVTSLL